MRMVESSIAVLCLTAAAVVHARAVVPAAAVAAQQRRVECASLTGLQLKDARIVEAVAVPAAERGTVRAAHCRVSGVIGKEIRFAELLPDRWNERLFAGGGGGFVGRVENQAAGTVNLGYATVGTDTGHDADGIDASWALNNRERQINYGYLAIHRTADTAKAIVKAYYGTDPKYSYFFGCSNGGRQALMEAQRYPDDFDGIVSCAPALDFTNIAASFVKNTQAMYPNPKALNTPAISAENLRLLETRVLAACDGRGDVKDGMLDDPTACKFDLADLPACPDDVAGAGCVTRSQRAAIGRVYAPTTAAGAAIYPGQPFGGEGQTGGWEPWVAGTKGPSLEYAFGTQFFKYLATGREDWDYATYDLANWRKDTADAAGFLNAVDPDLGKFKRRGGKLILSHGWADPALNPLSTIDYFKQIQARDPKSHDYVRLFMMPGVLHCGGGAGPDNVDWFTAIADWVERGRAPERVVAEKRGENGAVVNARPLCPYPQRAVYDGKGNITQAGSYACGRAGSR